ncbi:hypothetical protein [Streptomyces sp. NRRL F-5755]|uniref:hypothetical protein n=1 Tax=Streptomyces sp. NRRL F-5755 TaxID=1519475 RepID=UPI000A6DAA28|nr:hypothetical protein [Streptomyces sp. NRRL F-5755]
MTEANSDDKVKHLEFLNLTVTRLANNSFLIRGWAITLVGALAGVTISSERPALSLISFIPTLGFWLLDFFYLHQERLFRQLYADVARNSPEIPSFSMDVSPYRHQVPRRKVLLSPTLCLFYSPLFLVSLAVLILG